MSFIPPCDKDKLKKIVRLWLRKTEELAQKYNDVGALFVHFILRTECIQEVLGIKEIDIMNPYVQRLIALDYFIAKNQKKLLEKGWMKRTSTHFHIAYPLYEMAATMELDEQEEGFPADKVWKALDDLAEDYLPNPTPYTAQEPGRPS